MKKSNSKQKKSNKKLYIIIGSAVGAALVVAAVVIAIILFSGNTSRDDTWQPITPDKEYYEIKDEDAERFLLTYDTDMHTAKEISDYYSERLAYALDIFCEDYIEDVGVKGLAYLNLHEGEIVEVDPVLYRALQVFYDEGSRMMFMGPLYEYYNRIFEAERTSSVTKLDPYKDEMAERICRELALYAEDNNAIQIELFSENKVCYQISDYYYDFLLSMDLYNFIGFGWMTDAFIVDFIADELIAMDYTYGTISSYTGFSRNMDTTPTDYSFAYYDKYRNNITLAATVSYKGNMSTVTFRNFPLNDIDGKFYYSYGNGTTIHSYLDKFSGKYVAACDTMVFHSKELSCAEVAVKSYGEYVCEVEYEESIRELLDEGIGAIWSDGTTIITTSDDVTLHDLYSAGSIKYTTVK